MKTNTIGERVMALIKYLGVSNQIFCQRTEISQSGLYHLIIKDNKVSLPIIRKIANAYPVREQWLVFGEGDMLTHDYFEERFNQVKEIPETLKDKILMLLEIFEMNQTDLANKIGISRATLVNWITGVNDKVSSRNRKSVYEAFPFLPEGFI